jgi:FkbM family methyltransferase
MFRELKRRLFPTKYLHRHNTNQLARLDKAVSSYQGAIDYLMAAAPIKSNDIKDLAYFFHRKRNEARGQLFQDLWVLWETKGKSGGYFVEFGAADGINLSNTYLLETKYAWKGILAEPTPSWHEELKKREVIVDTRCVWTTSGEKVTFLCSDIPEYSGMAETGKQDRLARKRKQATKIEVETISLVDLLVEHKAPKVIDYLSIDTEGSEFEILSHFDYERFRINLITVEHNFSENQAKIHELLTGKGYLRVFEEFSDFDGWYVHRSLREGQA